MGNYCGDAKNEPKYPTNIEEKAKKDIDIFFEKYFPIQNRIKTGKKKDEKRKVNISIEFNDILKYMEVYENQLYFIAQLSQARVGKKRIRGDVFYYLEQIFSLIVKLLNENNNRNKDFGIVKDIFILSDTFFYENTKKEKIYLKEKLLKKNIFQSIEFWKKYSESIIDKAIDDSIKKYKIKPDDETINKLRDNNAYSKLMDIIFQLKNFGFEKSLIEEVIDKLIKKYGISEKNKIFLNSFINQ